VLDAVATMGRRKVAGAGADLIEGDEYYDRVFTQRINLWRLSDVVRDCLLSPDLGRMLCNLEGVEGMRLGHDQALIKEPFANPTTLHVDNPYWSLSSHHAISIWIALDDATVANGCLCFLPGSHKLARFEWVRFRDEFGALTEVYPEMRAIQPFVAEMKAGDCSFHNGLTAHGAGVNMTNGRRIAMACGYMPEGSRFNGQQNVYPESYVSALALDAVLDNEAFNPLIYSRA
jgi:ectoine hydroxylase-related dioxygenase (phytanoyl-CoA dioxygenase family)